MIEIAGTMEADSVILFAAEMLCCFRTVPRTGFAAAQDDSAVAGN
jgi:hypothetical protein